MNLDFKSYKVASQYAERINHGYSLRLKLRFVEDLDESPESQAIMYGWRQCDDYERSKGREMGK